MKREGVVETAPFRDLKPSMVTLLTPVLSGEIDFPTLYHLLPIEVTDIEPEYKPRVRKMIIPVYGLGEIFAVKYNNSFRCQFEIDGKTFPNCTEVVISTGKINLSVKLYRNSILVCGSNGNNERTKKCVTYLEETIRSIKNILHYIRKYPDSSERVFKWIRLKTEGKNKNGIVRLSSPKVKSCKGFTENEKKIFKFFTTFLPECYVHRKAQDYYLSKLMWIIDSGISFQGFKTGHLAVNLCVYIFKLGMNIDLVDFRDRMRKHEELYVLYDSMIQNSVMVKIFFSEDYVERHSFEISKSGCVRMCSTSVDEVEDAYYLFMNTVADEYN